MVFGKDHRELVAAESGDHVGGTQLLAQHVGRATRSVSSPARVAERVVDLFEVVEIERQQCPDRAVANDACCLMVELGFEAATVLQTGQRVVLGEMLSAGCRTACGR